MRRQDGTSIRDSHSERACDCRNDCGIAGTMAAYVIESAQHAIVATHDQQRLSDQVESKVVAGIRNLTDVSYQLPRI